MLPTSKVRYLKIDRGRYYYQRRIPNELQTLLDMKVWRQACGNVSYAKAVQMVVTWAEEHDEFIKRLVSPQERQQYAARERDREEAAQERLFDNEFRMYSELPDEEKDTTVHPNVYWLKHSLKELEKLRGSISPFDYEILQLQAKINKAKNDATRFQPISLPPLDEYISVRNGCTNADIRDKIILDAPIPAPRNDDEYLADLKSIHRYYFGTNSAAPPVDIDQREELYFLQKKLERKIANLQPDPHTICALSEKYFAFNNIKEATKSKYRRDIGRLVSISGDLPINQIETHHLKRLRDESAGTMMPASLHAVFTPIKGLFRYAAQEELIDVNPMSAVALPRDKRPLEERKWKKFEPKEMQRIDKAINDIWGQNFLGLSEERRVALIMVVRTLMFTGMRPIEVLRLTPDSIDENMIRITDSKTESSTRVIPLHPELSTVPAWVASGGLKTFESIKTDQTASVRHNFTRLLRTVMQPPITDKQKTLYSLRTTFVNAMRRAGADIQMQRAILGHKEAGAIRHYDDGPEFKMKVEAVCRTDPRREDD
jgi:integrase